MKNQCINNQSVGQQVLQNSSMSKEATKIALNEVWLIMVNELSVISKYFFGRVFHSMKFVVVYNVLA